MDGFRSKRSQILLWQFLPLHFVMYGPMRSQMTEFILDGTSWMALNWIEPPSPIGLYILYLSSRLKDLYIQDCEQVWLNLDNMAFMFLLNNCSFNILLIGYVVSLLQYIWWNSSKTFVEKILSGYSGYKIVLPNSSILPALNIFWGLESKIWCVMLFCVNK